MTLPVRPARRPRRRSPFALVAAALTTLLALLLPLLGTVTAEARPSAAAAAGDGVPSDQPLPGWTISNPPLAPLTIKGQQTQVLQGVRDHAAYKIEIPADWNGELVLWAHGYRGAGRVLTVDPPGYRLRQRFLKQGYAWAASSYAKNDYDVATGVRTTYRLARYAAARVLPSSPTRTYIAGVSMGGHVIGRSLEQYPRFYDGALPMCGVLGDQELFDYFLSYNLLAQDLSDLTAYPPPADYLTSLVPGIQQSLGIDAITPASPVATNDRGRQLQALTRTLSGGVAAGSLSAFAIFKDFLFTLYSADNGGPLSQNALRIAQNADTVYSPSAPVDVNTTVQRVTPPDPFSRSSRQLTQIPLIQGNPRVPVLTLHGVGDLFVPFKMEQVYRREVDTRGEGDLLVQRAIRSAGHCEFTGREVNLAWDELTRWVRSRDGDLGREFKPKGDDVLTPATLASPTYGCRFTDPSGYGDPTTPTRAIYPACPQ